MTLGDLIKLAREHRVAYRGQDRATGVLTFAGDDDEQLDEFLDAAEIDNKLEFDPHTDVERNAGPGIRGIALTFRAYFDGGHDGRGPDRGAAAADNERRATKGRGDAC